MTDTALDTELADTPQILLAHHLKALKLPTFLREYDKVAQLCAAEGVDHPRYLMRLAELEMIDRERRMVERRIKAAKFPTVKSLDSFDFLALPSLNKMAVLELARCDYIGRRENVIAVGNSGTGKSHIALGLGLAACQKGLSVGFITAAALVHELLEARDEKRLLRLQRQLAGYKLLIIRCPGRQAKRRREGMSWDMCRFRHPVPSCCSKYSRKDTNAAPRWSPATCRSTSGRPCSAPNA